LVQGQGIDLKAKDLTIGRGWLALVTNYT